MIKSFGNKGTEDIFNGNDTRAAQKTLPKELWANAQEQLDQLNAAAAVGDMKLPPSNRLHKMKGQLKEWWSVSINMKFRIIFKWLGTDAHEVEINNHYED